MNHDGATPRRFNRQSTSRSIPSIASLARRRPARSLPITAKMPDLSIWPSTILSAVKKTSRICQRCRAAGRKAYEFATIIASVRRGRLASITSPDLQCLTSGFIPIAARSRFRWLSCRGIGGRHSDLALARSLATWAGWLGLAVAVVSAFVVAAPSCNCVNRIARRGDEILFYLRCGRRSAYRWNTSKVF